MARCPFAKWNPLPQRNRAGDIQWRAGRRAPSVKTFVVHSQEGTGNIWETFMSRRAGKPASVHFWVRKDGSLEQLVSTWDTAFTNGSKRGWWDDPVHQDYKWWREAKQYGSNDISITCELEGRAGEPMNEAQYKTAKRLLIWVWINHGSLPRTLVEKDSLARHYEFAATACDSNRWELTRLAYDINNGVYCG